MIKSSFFVVCMSAVSALSLSLPPSVASAAEAAWKIGYVDMSSALNMIDEGKREKDKLKRDFDGKQKKLTEKQEELQKYKEEFDKQRAMLKEDVRAKKENELQQKFVELQKLYMDMQKDLNEREAEVTKGIFTKMRSIVEKIGDRDGYSLILDRREDNVLFYKRHMDITDEVVKQYNAQHK